MKSNKKRKTNNTFNSDTKKQRKNNSNIKKSNGQEYIKITLRNQWIDTLKKGEYESKLTTAQKQELLQWIKTYKGDTKLYNINRYRSNQNSGRDFNTI